MDVSKSPQLSKREVAIQEHVKDLQNKCDAADERIHEGLVASGEQQRHIYQLKHDIADAQENKRLNDLEKLKSKKPVPAEMLRKT